MFSPDQRLVASANDDAFNDSEEDFVEELEASGATDSDKDDGIAAVSGQRPQLMKAISRPGVPDLIQIVRGCNGESGSDVRAVLVWPNAGHLKQQVTEALAHAQADVLDNNGSYSREYFRCSVPRAVDVVARADEREVMLRPLEGTAKRISAELDVDIARSRFRARVLESLTERAVAIADAFVERFAAGRVGSWFDIQDLAALSK